MDGHTVWIEELEKEVRERIAFLERESLRLSNGRGLLFLLALIPAIFAFQNPERYLFHGFCGLSLLGFTFLAYFHKKKRNEKEELETIRQIASDYRKKKTCDFSGFEFNGTEFYKEGEGRLDTSKYPEDLHIVGENSLFQFLNAAVSGGGRYRLFQALLHPNPLPEEIGANQAAIEELAANRNFVLYFQQKMRKGKDLKDRRLSASFLQESMRNRKKSLLVLALSVPLSLATVLTLVLGLLGALSLNLFNLLFSLQIALSLFYGKVFEREFHSISADISPASRFQDLYSFIVNTDFAAEKNVALRADIAEGIASLKKFRRLDNLDSLRKNIFSYLFFNGFCSINAWIAYRYYSILEEDKQAMIRSLRAIEEFELLISLCSVNLLKETICKPEILSVTEFAAEGLVYPLIPEELCVSNDFACGEELNIITGSNMSGKTSFMRSIGVNMVLTYAGAFANASGFRVPILRLFTSINVKDDISKGISTFYGELLRIRDILDFVKKSERPIIVFIDEIFKGTNYADRIYGAKKVLEQLSRIPCIVFLTTHDFELCEMEDGKIKNYHFSEEYRDGKMVFSHKIKAGKCESTNAKELMREIGIV